MKPHESHRIYYVFSTSDHRSCWHFRTQTHQKAHLRTDTANSSPQIKKTSRLIKTDSQEGPQIHQKSMKIQPWTPRCPLWCPCGPMDHQHGDPRCKIKPPRYQNGASRSPKLQFRIKQIILSAINLSAITLSTCRKGGRRQGRILKIRRAV